jgi:tRNA (mo5U34)-methyltransferase
MSSATAADFDRRDIDALGPWFHNLHLPDGRQTAPNHMLGDFPACKWRQFADALPADLSGWRALDIGCNAGFYSFELARRGAEVVGIDCDQHYLDQGQWAARLYGLADRVRFERRQVYTVARERRHYDLVLFMGVFYHLRYPMLAMDSVARLKPRLMVFQTLTAPGEEVYEIDRTQRLDFDNRELLNAPGWPKMSFVEHEFCDDPTNWWVPNHAAVLAILRSAGFRVAARPGHEIYICEPSSDPPPEGWDEEEWQIAAGPDRS